MDLSWNELSGPIPPEIWNLTNLNFLSLSDNQLTGEIPLEIGTFINLLDLDLSNNQLSGIIPDEICNIFVNIRNNQLCPSYPSCVEDYVGVQDTTNCD